MPRQTLHVTRHAKMPGFIINSAGYEMINFWTFKILLILKLVNKFNTGIMT